MAAQRQIPFFPWVGLFKEREEQFMSVIRDCLGRGAFILQRDVEELERDLEKYTGAKHAIAVSDATNSMLLGLRALGLEPGFEVVIPSHSFIAAAQSIHFAGGVPVPVELGPDGMVCPDDMERAITPKTKLLMPVQVNGRMADMGRIMDIARRHKLTVVEDSAQALGAKFDGRQAGTIGVWGCFSFYPSKTLGTFGDAGALITNDDEIARNVRAQRNHGANAQKTIEASNPVWGTNCRMDNLHAAILKYKLTYYDEAIARRRAIATQYQSAFAGIPQLTLPPAPGAEANRFDVFQNYEIEADRRDALRARLSEAGIGSIVQWGGLALHQMTGIGFKQKLPKTDRFFERCMLLPMHHLLSDDDVAYVCQTVQAFYR